MASYLIASGIPIFDGLVSLIDALFNALLAMQPAGAQWLYDNWKQEPANRNAKWMLLVAWSIFLVVAGTFITIAGTYGAVIGIIGIVESLEDGSQPAPWTCAGNSS